MMMSRISHVIFLRYSWWFYNHAKTQVLCFSEIDFYYLGGCGASKWSHCTCEGQKSSPGIAENKCFLCLFLLDSFLQYLGLDYLKARNLIYIISFT